MYSNIRCQYLRALFHIAGNMFTKLFLFRLSCLIFASFDLFDPRHDNHCSCHIRTAKAQISLRGCASAQTV